MDRRQFGLSAAALLASTQPACIGQVQPRRSNTKRVKWKGAGKKVVGYFTNWAQYRKRDCKFEVSHIDANLFTHIIYGFGKVGWGADKKNPKFEIEPFEHNDLGPGGQYQQVNDLKKKYPHLKTLLAIGGWTFNDPPEVKENSTAWVFTTMVESPENRAYFIDSSIRYLRANNFDGLDLDWEYPGDEGRGGRPEDKQNFSALCREFKQAAAAEAARSGKEPMLLTMAAGAHKSGTLELDQLAKHLDWINLMTYDFYGGWSNVTGMNSPLSGDSTGEKPWYVEKAVHAFLDGGIPPEKLVMGMPSYGRSFTGVVDPRPAGEATGAGPKGRCTGEPGFLAYYEIVDAIESGKYKTYWDPVSETPYAYDESGKNWITYDDLRSISLKVDFIEEMDLGGGMFWAIDLDDFHNDYPLVTSVSRRLRGPDAVAGTNKKVATK